jgi:hypothetical protein
MLSSLGANVVQLNDTQAVDAQCGPIALKAGDTLQIGSMRVFVSIPVPAERGTVVKELVRTFTPQDEELVTRTPAAASASEEERSNIPSVDDSLMNAEKDVDAVLEGIETSFLRAEAERHIKQEREVNNARLEQMQVRVTDADARTAAALAVNQAHEAKIAQLSKDLQQSAEIASTAIAEAGRLRMALQEKHGKDGQEVLRLRAELDSANAAAETAQQRNLQLSEELATTLREKAVEQKRATDAAARLAEEHELEVSLLQVERDEARYQAHRNAAEAHAWADANPYRKEQPSLAEQARTAAALEEPADEAVEQHLHQVLMSSSHAGSGGGSGGGGGGSDSGGSGSGSSALKPPAGMEDVGPAAYEKQLKVRNVHRLRHFILN